VEAFIIKAAGFFDASGTNKTIRGLLVLGLLSKELRDIFEARKKPGDKGFTSHIFIIPNPNSLFSAFLFTIKQWITSLNDFHAASSLIFNLISNSLLSVIFGCEDQ